MELKKYLENIGIEVEDNVVAFDFLKQEDIKSYLSLKWEQAKLEKKITSDIPTSTPDAAVEAVTTMVIVETPEEDMEVVSQESESEQLQPEPDAPVAEEQSEAASDEVESENNNEESQNTEKMFGLLGSKDKGQSPEEQARIQNEIFEASVRTAQISLQNGKEKIPYEFKLSPSFVEAFNIGEHYFEGIAEIGLIFDTEDKKIKGIPEKSGDYKIMFYFKHKDRDDGPYMSREVSLIINPDPRSLWENKPTPPNIEYPKPDSDKQFLPVADKPGGIFSKAEKRKDMVAASQRGRSHAHEGKPRDDDFGLAYDTQSEWYTMVVADGAGSAKYSRRGSEIACKTIIEECGKRLTDQHKLFCNLIRDYEKDPSPENRKKTGDEIYEIVGKSVFKAYKDIESEASLAKSPIKDFSTTLIVSVCRKFDFGWFVASFWVGDGGIGIYDKENQYLRVLGESDGGEFAGQTRFLTMPEIIQPAEIYRRLRFEIVKDFTALILMTDGITDPKFETDANLMRIEKWHDLWNDLSEEVTFDENNKEIDSQLLKWLDYWVPGNHDDRTIAILF